MGGDYATSHVNGRAIVPGSVIEHLQALGGYVKIPRKRCLEPAKCEYRQGVSESQEKITQALGGRADVG